MKRYRASILLGTALVLISALSYFAQIELFHKSRDTFFYLLQDLAFLPIQVLLVTLILTDLLSRRQKQEMRNKLNMVIGAFFSEMGRDLLQQCMRLDENTAALRPLLQVSTDWTPRDFSTAKARLVSHRFAIDCQRRELGQLKSTLIAQRAFMLTLLENPNLLEHETFTDLLWAISHLTEELAFRESLQDLPETDYAHLAGDLQRAYRLLLTEWLSYAQHLRNDYPYIFSLVVRMNPYNTEASPVVR